MFKKILIILLIFTSSVCAEVVKEIKIEGNNRISSETIKIYGEIELGRDYSKIDVNNILKNLYSTDFFEDIKIELQNNNLKIIVKEFPIINDIILQGEKSNKIKEYILENLQLKSKASFISSKLNSDRQLIKQLYSSLGYNFASIDFELEKFPGNRVNILYSITKGEKSFIKTINFNGDKVIRNSKLKDIIASEEKKFWKILSKNTYYNKTNIELDKRLLKNYYKSLGYYDVQVLSNEVRINEKNEIILTYTINSGTRYKISKIKTNVDNVLDKKIFTVLENKYLPLIGDYYSPFKIKKLLDEVEIVISNSDLQFVEHSVNEILNAEDIELTINIFEGKKETVERINIIGNSVTNEDVIRGEFLMDEGDPFSGLQLDKTIAKLKSRNIFGEVQSKVLDGSKKDLKVIEISVEEKPTGEISAGAGVGTNGGSFAFNISENNWLGKGVKISTNFDVSSDAVTGGFLINDPNYNFSGNSLAFFASNTKNDKLKKSGYKNNIFSTGFGTSFEQYKDIYLAPNITFSYDDLKVTDTASANLKKQKGTFKDLSLDYSIISDKRDRAYGPTDGHIINFNQVLPMYADAPFIKNTISFSKYHSFSEEIIGAFKFFSAAITGVNNENVRISKRIFVPSNRLRGFESGKVGPKDGDDFIGGNYVATGNIELNLPKLLPESTNVDIGLFLDAGNIWHVDYDSSLNDSSKLRSSVGVNSSWLSPAGPMTFVFSQNLSKAKTDVTESFNFKIGTTF